MLKLIEANFNDIEKQYKVIKSISDVENGFENEYYNCSYENFKNVILPGLIEYSKGINLKVGYVLDTYYFLYDEDVIVGLFKIRHYLNEYLRNGPGHIGYFILKEYRGCGYASKGLILALEICKNLIKEDEVYFSVYKSNIASLKVLLKNGAYITKEDEEEYFVKIKLKNKY